MIYRIYFVLILLVSLVGCRSARSRGFDAALRDGPDAIARACTNGAAAACAVSGRSATASHPVSILQGLTSGDRARFTVVVPKGAEPRYFVRDGELSRVLAFTRTDGPAGDFAVDLVEATELRPDVDFELIVVDGRGGTLWDRRSFRALDPAKSHARLALISATDDQRLREGRAMWASVLAQNVDAIVLLGDHVFVDHVRAGRGWIRPDPATIWRRYVETRGESPLYFAPKLTPVLATWDDHDFAHNGGDATYPYRDQSRDTFLTFFPQARDGDNFRRGPGVASAWRVFGINLVLTDNRYYRSVNRAPGPQTHFGPAQDAWLVDQLARANGPTLLASGDQFFGGYHGFESFEGCHPDDFRASLAAWRTASKAPLAFLSGDRHLTEIIGVPAEALGYPTFEITSSGLHAPMFADAFKVNPSPHQIVGVAGQLNYSVLEIMRSEPALLRLGVQSFGPGRQLLYQRTLTVKP